MGIRIELPKPVWDKVLSLADTEYRTPKQQCEYLVMLALGIELPFGVDGSQSEIGKMNGKITELEARIALLERRPPSTVAACGTCGAAVHTDNPMYMGLNGLEYICRECTKGDD
jgi:hypothetical protein